MCFCVCVVHPLLRSCKNPQSWRRHRRHPGFASMSSFMVMSSSIVLDMGPPFSSLYPPSTPTLTCFFRLRCFTTRSRIQTPRLQNWRPSLALLWLVSFRRWRTTKVCLNRRGSVSRWNTHLTAAIKPNWSNWLTNCTTWGTWTAAHLLVSITHRPTAPPHTYPSSLLLNCMWATQKVFEAHILCDRCA